MKPIPLTDTQMAELFRLRAENAALKEQVAQLEADAAHLGPFYEKQLTTLQSKSAALVEALTSIKHSMDMGLLLGNDKHRELVLSQGIAKQALATVKEK